MKIKLVVTGILKCKDEYLSVKRSEDDELYPGAWEFPGGHLEENETLEEGLKRELKEEIGYDKNFVSKLIGYDEEIYSNLHRIEFNFLIDVNKDDVKVKLSREHSEYKWIKKDSELFDDYIKNKIKDI